MTTAQLGRTEKPLPHRHNRKGRPGFLAELGRMWHAAKLAGGDTCRWCDNKLEPRQRKHGAYLECARCDGPGSNPPGKDITE